MVALAALAFFFVVISWNDLQAFESNLLPRIATALCVIAATSALLYFLCRNAWGELSAFVAVAVFLAVFAFSPFAPTTNLNGAVRAAHHATRGLFAALLLALVLVRWVARTNWFLGLCAGLIAGLTTALIPEFALVGAAAILAAFFLRWRADGWLGFGAVVVIVLGVAIPLAAFSFFPQHHFRLTNPLIIFPPLETIADDFTAQAFVVFVAAGLIAAVAAGAALAQRLQNLIAFVSFSVLGSAALLWVSLRVIPWREVDRSLLGLVLLYLIITLARMYFRGSPEERRRQSPRLLLAVAASALIVATPLYMRLQPSGFQETALAACVLSAILFGELWAWFRLQERARIFTSVASAALLVPGVVILARHLA